MIITTTKNYRVKVSEDSSYKVIKHTKFNQGFWRWILILLLFWPLLFAYFFVGDKCVLVQIDGERYELDMFQYGRLVDYLDK